MKPIKKIQDMKTDMTRWRQKLHAEPELAFEERKTARYIKRMLESFGIETAAMAKTGVIGILHGKAGPGGKGIMLRSDMDALPLNEETGVLHSSRHPGAHHACGHDGHMAMLLGAAKYLAETKNFDGTVYFVFQPAEEHIGGAKEMIKEGLFTKYKIDEVYGLHNYPGLPLGMMASGKGPMLAASDEYHVRLEGKGGHSARPENTLDVVAAAAEIITAIKKLAKEEIGKDEPAILSVCSVRTDTDAANILPERMELSGSIRTYDAELHGRLKEGIEKILDEAADRHGVGFRLEYKNGYPMLVNSDRETDFALDVARENVGDKNVMSAVPRTMGVEDFASFLREKPGNFMALGTGRADGKEIPDLHSCKYDFNDAALPVGASYWVRLVEKALPRDAAPVLPKTPPLNPPKP